jgi:PAS domain S-box-containing protein
MMLYVCAWRGIMKMWHFIWERLRSPFIPDKHPAEYPSTFRQELNGQCGRILFFGALIATFAWLPYIHIDRQLQPGEPLIVALRIGMSLVGLTILVLQVFKRFRRYNLIFLILLAGYLELATGLITGLTKADPSYLGGYLLVLTVLALAPIPRREAWSILAVSLLVFFITGFAKGMHFDSAKSQYIMNDILVTVLVVAFFIYLLDRLRFNSWEKSRKIKQQNEELRENEDRLRTIIDGTQALLITVDVEGRITYANDATAEALGYKTAAEIIGRLYLDFVHSDERQRVRNGILNQINALQQSSIHEFRVVDTESQVKWFSFVSTLIIKDGKFVGMTGVAQNITERKQAEDARRKSEARYRTFFEHTAVGVAEIEHVTGRFLTVNPRLCGILGRTEEEMRNTTFQAITHPDDLHLHEEKTTQLLTGTIDHYTLEKRYIAKDGAVIWVNITVSDPRETGETHGRNIVIVEDITERKRTEAALQSSEEKFRQIVSSIPNVVSILDMKLQPTYVSASVQRILGYTPEEAMTMTLEQLCTPESLAIAFKSFQDRVEANAKTPDPNYVLVLELEEYHKNGSTVFLENTMTFLRDAKGVPVGILCVSADITERKRTEAALQASKDAADAANQSKSIFLANMSHEIRTPMNAILGFSQLMQRDPSLSLQSREHLDIINRSGEHLLALINDILEMSKIEAGRATFVPNTFDLHSLLKDLEMMFRVRTDAKRLRFLLEEVGDVPRWVITDEGKLRQILINLLGNAVKFTEEGGIALRLRTKDGKTDTADLQFEVEDTGPGMAEDEIGRLFQAFEQTSSGIKSGGTGLGLALSRGFIELMGGTISVTSTVGKGSIFRFNIPVREDSEEHAARQEARRRVLCIKPGQDEIRILIADDRETNRQLLSQMLASVGFVTRYAVNGVEAVQMVHEWKPRLVLMDMAMPVMDGYEATNKIKASPDIKSTAIVAVTASAFEEDKKRILDEGADDYLSKPFKDAELFEIIGRLTGAEYVYEETGGGEKASEASDDKALMRKSIAALPLDLVGQLRDAVESADLDRLNDLAKHLITDNPTLAQRIQEMAARYEYEALIELFSQGE